MGRYRAEGAWREIEAVRVNGFDGERFARVSIEMADCRDLKDQHLYARGARRVLRDGKPVRGKGGSVPFYGELAWCDAERLAHDIEQSCLTAAREAWTVRS